MNRRIFMKLAGATAVSSAGGLMYCAAEPYRLTLRKRLVALNCSLPRSMRILHVSDLHIGNRQQLEFTKKSLLDGLAQKPDLICMAGDFINRKLFDPNGCRALFRKLAAHAPVFACLGNHDGGTWAGRIGGYSDPSPVADLLYASGVAVLRNESTLLKTQGQVIALVGIDDLWSGTMNVERGFGEVKLSPDIPRIVLAHNPDMKSELKNQAWDLMLCGHTHGGQVHIPGVGRPVLPVKDRRYTHGLYQWEQRQIHVSSGVGTSCGVRFNCPPEICMLELNGTV